MTSYDRTRANEQSAKLKDSIQKTLALHNSRLNQEELEQHARTIVAALCTIRAPEQPEPVLHFVTMKMGGRTGGRSAKPGNVLLNMRTLMVAISSSTVAVVGMLAHPAMAPVSALVLWDSLYSKSTIELTEREGSVIWAMWLNRDKGNKVKKDSLLSLVNDERKHYERDALSSTELHDALERLKKIRTIEEKEDHWWLREWVRVNYS